MRQASTKCGIVCSNDSIYSKFDNFKKEIAIHFLIFIQATAVVFDYKYSLRGLDVTSDIYQETRSKVRSLNYHFYFINLLFKPSST